MAPKPPTKSDAPYENVSVVRKDGPDVEQIHIGPIRLDVLEDGRNTDNRLGAVNLILPPGAKGPPEHWHQMHDETFLVISGRAAFISRNARIVANAGDYIVVPPYSPHTFENDSEDDGCVIYNTFTPAYYVNYFRYMAQCAKEEGGMTEEIGARAMARYATIQVNQEKGNPPI